MNQHDPLYARDHQEAREEQRDSGDWLSLLDGVEIAPMTPAEEKWFWTMLGCDVAAKRERARIDIDGDAYMTTAALLDSVVNADALDLLRRLDDGSVDAIITDPPYGLAGRVFEFPHKHYSAINEEWDNFAPIDWMQACAQKLVPGGSVICFGVRQSIYLLAAEGLRLNWRLVNDITWFKPDAPPNFTGRMMTESTERALWFCPSGANWTYNLEMSKLMNSGMNLRDVWRFKIEHTDRVHPSQKPLTLMERCVLLFTNPGDLIVDPFAGSGTTGVAAIKNGRHFIGADNGTDTRTGRLWADIANERMALPFTARLFD